MEPHLLEEDFTPKDTEKDDFLLVGALDASEPLSSVWRQMAYFYNSIAWRWKKKISIIFNSQVRKIKGPVSCYIHDFGLGERNLRKAFLALEDAVISKKKAKRLCIIIISEIDEGNLLFKECLNDFVKNPGLKGKRCSLIVLRVSTKLPTFLSMSLKKFSFGTEQNFVVQSMAGIVINRNITDNSNPWLLNVVEVAELCNDTHSSMLPLFGERNLSMRSFVNSELFHEIIDFCAMKKIYRRKYSTFAALLSKALIFLLQGSKTSSRDDMISKIFFTYFHFVLDSQKINHYKNLLLTNPRKAMTHYPREPDLNICESLSKPLSILLVLIKFKVLADQGKIQKIIEAIMCENVARTFCFGKSDILENYVTLSQSENVIAYYQKAFYKVLSLPNIDFFKYQDEKELKYGLQLKLKEISLPLFDLKLEINEHLFLKRNGELNFKLLETIYTKLTGKQFARASYAPWLISSLERDSSARNDHELDEEELVSTFLRTVILNKLYHKILTESFERSWPGILSEFNRIKQQNTVYFQEALRTSENVEAEGFYSRCGDLRVLLNI